MTIKARATAAWDLLWAGRNEDASEQVSFDYLSTNEALLTVMGGKKQVQLTMSAQAMLSLRDALNRRYPVRG